MGRRIRSSGLKSRSAPSAYQPRQVPRIRVLIQELDASGIYSLRGEHFSIVGAKFDEVVDILREALMEKYAAFLGRGGKLIFIPYSAEEQETKCPYCGAIMEFDPHDKNCPLHKILVYRWISSPEKKPP
ncbi:MAG: hypothetical protein QXG35_00590 [Nitrososphaerota archaeon]